jgi:hypothetical protein
MTDTEDVRGDLYAWAIRRAILTESGLQEAAKTSGDPSLVPFADDHAEYFRTRRIMRIRADSEAPRGGRVTISTRQAIAVRKVDELRRVFDAHYAADGITLAVTTAPSYKVDQTIKTYGPPFRTRRERITCGSSVGIGNQRNAGTLTALVRRVGQPELLGLSCNHVIGGCSTTLPGTPIVVPGIQDVTPEYAAIDVVGTFAAAASMRQGLPTVSEIGENGDLACFELNDRGNGLLTSWHGTDDDGYDTPSEFLEDPTAKTRVRKWGRSTARTEGQFQQVLTDEPLEYAVVSYFGPQASQTFRGTIYYPVAYEVLSTTREPFSDAGDSGSLVVTVEPDGRPPRVFGIVIAGGPSKSLVLPLKPILDKMQLELVTNYPPERSRARRSRTRAAGG